MIQGEVKNIEYLFVYALVWAIGGALTEKDGLDYRKEFSNWWKGIKNLIKINYLTLLNRTLEIFC